MVSVFRRLSSSGNLLRRRELRVQRVQQHCRRHAPYGELRGAIEESTPVDLTVHVLIEEVQELLIEIAGLLAFHSVPPPTGQHTREGRGVTNGPCPRYTVEGGRASQARRDPR